MIKLSVLSILLGVAVGVPQLYALAQPDRFIAHARKFPRNVPVGIALMLLATTWFVWNVHVEPIADFAAIKHYMMAAFAAIGIGACFFVQDFLAVRGLAVLLLLLAKLMLDTGRPYLATQPLVYVIQVWGYVWVVAGIWLTISPWRLRDWIQWATATEQRVKAGSWIRLAIGLVMVVLGLTAFRTL